MSLSTYTLRNQTLTTTSTSSSTTTLSNEIANFVNEMFTTIYNGDINDINNHPSNSSPQLALGTLVHSCTDSTTTTMMNSLSAAEPIPWTTTHFSPISPTSPILSCFSSSGNNTDTDTEAAYFTPVTCLTPRNDFSAVDTSLDAAIMIGLGNDYIYSSDDLCAGAQVMGDLLFDTAVGEIANSVPSLGGFDYHVAEVAHFADEYLQQPHQHHYSDVERDKGKRKGKEKPLQVDKGALHICETDVNINNTSTKSHNGHGSNSMQATSPAATATGTKGGPSRRSGSRSRLTTFSPYPSSSSSSSSPTSPVPSSSSSSSSPTSSVPPSASLSRKQHKNKKKNKGLDKNNDSMWKQVDLSEAERQRQEQVEQVDIDNHINHDNDNAVSTCAPSSSLSSTPSSHCSSPGASITTSISSSSSTPASTSTLAPEVPLRIPGTEGMTTIHHKDGSIMCFNPATGTCIYYCDLCLAAADHPTSSSSPSSFSPSSSSSNSHIPSFGRIHDLKRHQNTTHHQAASLNGRGPAKMWLCEFCEKTYSRRDALFRHYTVKSAREDGVHPTKDQKHLIDACRARAKHT
ncbi:MAG: hypothetical protein J3R72DRAFT_514603 [Linnemannia gamsii]|nr:MAG: hypothetical protein J3R72DRAFT_514603 [Linnemannia gamsii]